MVIRFVVQGCIENNHHNAKSISLSFRDNRVTYVRVMKSNCTHTNDAVPVPVARQWTEALQWNQGRFRVDGLANETGNMPRKEGELGTHSEVQAFIQCSSGTRSGGRTHTSARDGGATVRKGCKSAHTHVCLHSFPLA